MMLRPFHWHVSFACAGINGRFQQGSQQIARCLLLPCVLYLKHGFCEQDCSDTSNFIMELSLLGFAPKGTGRVLYMGLVFR